MLTIDCGLVLCVCVCVSVCHVISTDSNNSCYNTFQCVQVFSPIYCNLISDSRLLRVVSWLLLVVSCSVYMHNQ